MTADKPLTKAQIITNLAEANDLSKSQITGVLESLANLAYAEANKGFTVPGLGKLVLVNRKARTGRNPATGEVMQIPAKTVLKFRIAKAAKDAVAK